MFRSLRHVDPPLHRRRHGATRRTLLVIPAIACTLLLLVACGQTPNTGPGPQAGANTPSSITPTLSGTIPGSPLKWRNVSFPQRDLAFTVAPGNGDVAYACVVVDGSRIAIWVTRDRALHWTHTADIAVKPGTTQCSVTVDGLLPDTAVVAVTDEKLGANAPIAEYTSYVTGDGGRTWLKLSGARPYLIFQFYMLGGITYAYLRISSQNTQDPMQDESVLAVSNDQMQTWHTIFSPVTESVGFGGMAFWLNPDGGALLVESDNAFASSVDGGAHWTTITVPGMNAPGANIVVQQPITRQPWHLCVAGDDTNNITNPRPNTLTCSTDGGKTWQTKPGLNIVFTNVKGTFVSPAGVFALADDGAVLATIYGPTSPNTSDYRLSATGQQWQTFGLTPGGTTARYFPAPGNGVLWADSQEQLLTTDYP